MKIIALLLPVTIAFLLASCESEYSIQLDKAKALVRQEQQLLHALPAVNVDASDHHHALSALREDIAFHAHMSGNEEVFAQELDSFRADLENAVEDGDVLISKFP